MIMFCNRLNKLNTFKSIISMFDSFTYVTMILGSQLITKNENIKRS